MLVLVSSMLVPCILLSSQPTNNLYAKYYDNHNRWTGAGANFIGNVIHTRTFTSINTSNYNPAGRGDYWSVVIEGYIYAPIDGNYSFRTISDDGIRVILDGTTVVNNWTNHAPRYDYGSINLQTGWKRLRIEMYEWGGGTRLQFTWKPPNQSNYDYPPSSYLSQTLPDTTTPTLSNVSITSDNSTSTLVKDGDDITLTFTASEAIGTPVVTFQSGGAAITDGSIVYNNTSGNTWTADLTLKENITAGLLKFYISFNDTTGNSGISVSKTTDGTNISITLDEKGPLLLSSTPGDNSVNIELDSSITLNFDESIFVDSGEIELFKLDGTLVETFLVSPAMISDSVITLVPTSSFEPSTNYYVLISPNGFLDSKGNSYEGITKKSELNFETLDSVPPSLLSSTPSDNSTNVSVDQNIVLKFSEEVVAGFGEIEIFQNNNTLIETFKVSSSLISGATVTLNPFAELEVNSSYYILIPSSAFFDTDGNALSGIDKKIRINFTTVALKEQFDAPILISSSPNNGAKDVEPTEKIVLTFNEDIFVRSGKVQIFQMDGTLIETLQITPSMISGSTINLDPISDFKPNVSYYVLIPPTALKNNANIDFEGNIFHFKIRKKTPKEEFSEVKDDVGAKMTANTTKQIRNFATATSAVVTAARSRAITNRSRSSGSISTNRSSNGSQGNAPGSNSNSNTNTGNPNGSDRTDTETFFDLRSSTRGTNASGKINGIIQSNDGKFTRYTESQFNYTKSKNGAETGSASSQVIFEQQKSVDLTLGRFIGLSVSKNSTKNENTTSIDSFGLQLGGYFVKNISENLFIDGYLATSLIENKIEISTTTMQAEADYLSRMGAVGFAVTGSFNLKNWEIIPTVALDYSLVSSQGANFEITTGTGNSSELSSPGNVKQFSGTFSPDFRTSFDLYDGYWSQGSTFSFKPKVFCQRVDQELVTDECGQGAALSIISQDKKALKTLTFTLGMDITPNDTTYSANALYKAEF